MSELAGQVRQKADEYFQEIQNIRHHLHAHPELSFQEYETAAYLKQLFEKWGFTDVHQKANTGWMVNLIGNDPGPTLVLRADIDALPIHENNEVPYKSRIPGVMHACGHDVHTSCMLGAMKILKDLKPLLKGNIRFIFQPGEEKAPGGASLMIEEGVLKNPVPVAVFGQHVMPLIDVGKVGFRSGKYMASADEIYFTVKGKGGHGAMPELAVDPIVIASNIIVSLQQLVSRMASPKIPSVLTFGRMLGEGANNVIPDEVRVEGTFRTFDEEWRATAHIKIRQLVTGMATAMGAHADFEIVEGYPFLQNDLTLTQSARQVAEDYLGEANVLDLDLWMASEDFAFYSQYAPACFYRLGVRNEKRGVTSNVHTSTFDIDEEALKIGMGLMAYQAICALSSQKAD